MQTIISTEHCFEGYDVEEECWVIDTYLNLDKASEIDSSTIQWDQNAWEDEKDYFAEFIESEIKIKNAVVIMLGGRVGRWNGNHVGGRPHDTDRKSIKSMLEMDVDDIEVKVDKDDREISILGHHHDGTHSMNIYLVSEKELKELKLLADFEEEGFNGLNNLDAVEKIVDNLETLKLSKGNQFFGVE